MSDEKPAGKALIFMTARNCEMYVAASIASVARQTYDDLHVLYIDDCSDDDTGALAERLLSILLPGRHTFVRNDTRFGKARNIWEHLRHRADAVEFIAVLDGDDQLIDAEILALMAKYYALGRDVVWSNYVTEQGAVGGNGPLSPDKPPRTQGWKTSHFFSFRAALLKTVPEDYFKDSQGTWLPAACDIALALPILDQTRHYEFIPINAYRYTAANPYSHHNLDPHAQGLNSAIQRQCAAEVFHKPPLPLLRPLATEPAMVRPSAPPSVQRDIWADKAAELLIVACPMLLNAHSVLAANTLSPLEVWRLYQLVSRAKGEHLLHVGTTSSAVYLAAIAASFPEVSFSCLTISDTEKADLETKLAASGLGERTTIIGSQMTSVHLNEGSGPFASTDPLDGSTPFSTAVVDARGHDQEAALLIVALPALARHFNPTGFHLCLLASREASLQAVAGFWRSRTTGLKFCLSGVGGDGLTVIGGH